MLKALRHIAFSAVRASIIRRDQGRINGTRLIEERTNVTDCSAFAGFSWKSDCAGADKNLVGNWRQRCACQPASRVQGDSMVRKTLAALTCVAAFAAANMAQTAMATYPSSYYPTGHYNVGNWERFYHYPYVYYPQNFWGNEYYRSSDSLYYRYPPEMRIPVYNRKWHSPYPEHRRYHYGHQFMLDVF